MVGIGSPLKKKKPLGGAAGVGAIGGQLDGAGDDVPDAPPQGAAPPPMMGTAPPSTQPVTAPTTPVQTPDINTPPPFSGATPRGDINTPGGNVEVEGSGAPPAQAGDPGYDAAHDENSLDAAIEAYIRSQIEGAGNVDTSEQEALIRELMGDQAGKSAVGNRASMGRAGFASSGALSAMQADAARAARQQAEQDILGVRTDAQGRATDAANAAIGLDIGMRDAATRGQQASAAQQALEALLAGGGNAPPAAEDEPGPVEQVTEGAQDMGERIDAAAEQLGVNPDYVQIVGSGDVPGTAIPTPAGLAYQTFWDPTTGIWYLVEQ